MMEQLFTHQHSDIYGRILSSICISLFPWFNITSDVSLFLIADSILLAYIVIFIYFRSCFNFVYSNYLYYKHVWKVDKIPFNKRQNEFYLDENTFREYLSNVNAVVKFNGPSIKK